MTARWPAWAAVSREDLIRVGLLLPRPGEKSPRRIIRLSPFACPPPPPAPMAWSGTAPRPVLVLARRGRAGRMVIGYCRADAWTSSARACYG